jgi:hypothetical protein
MFLTDLATLLLKFRSDNKLYIIMMDANTPINAPELLDFMDDHDLVDLMQDYLPNTHPPTYRDGQHQIGCILGSSPLLHSVTAAHIYNRILSMFVFNLANQIVRYIAQPKSPRKTTDQERQHSAWVNVLFKENLSCGEIGI